MNTQWHEESDYQSVTIVRNFNKLEIYSFVTVFVSCRRCSALQIILGNDRECEQAVRAEGQRAGHFAQAVKHRLNEIYHFRNSQRMCKNLTALVGVCEKKIGSAQAKVTQLSDKLTVEMTDCTSSSCCCPAALPQSAESATR